MSLNWDITKIEDTDNLCWTMQEDGTKTMDAVTETLIWATMFCYMDKISQQTYKDFHRRLVELEVISGKGLILLTHKETGEEIYRNPTLEEVKAHIGLSTNVSTKTKREWGSHLKILLQDEAQRRIDYMKREEVLV